MIPQFAVSGTWNPVILTEHVGCFNREQPG